MADLSPTEERVESDSSVEREAIGVKNTETDPGMIKLKRKPAKVSVITAAGVVFLAAMFLVRLHADRTFGGNDTPQPAAVADIVAGKVATNSFVTVAAEPMMAHAIRTATQKITVGLRVVPIRGSSDRLWVVIHGDGYDPPNLTGFTGRLRKLDDLPFIDAVREFATAHPRPLFATASATRAGFAGNEVVAVSGDRLKLLDSDRVALDLVDPNGALIIAAVNERHASTQAWIDALTAAGLTPGAPLPGPRNELLGADGKPTQVRFEITTPGAVAAVTAKLEAAGLWAARVEPITRHFETTWGELRTSATDGFKLGKAMIPDADLDLVGLYVAKGIPDDAYALITGEKPQEYWHVWWISIALALILLVFAWALVRAVKRDMLAPTTRAT